MKEKAYTPPAELLTSFNESPFVLVDVGARGGMQARWQPIAPQLVWIGFEPDARSATGASADESVRRRLLLTTALADAQKRVTLHLARHEGDSSLFSPNTEFLQQFARPERFDVVDEVELDADTLDNQLTDAGIDRVDFIKLDTQGSELSILRGAERALSMGVIGVEVEVEFSPLYVGQPLFADVDAWLRRFHLQLFDLAPRRWPYLAGGSLSTARGPIVWADAVYLQSAPATARWLADADETSRVPRLAKACTTALLYGFPDFALALIAASEELIEPDAAARLRRAVEQWVAESDMPIISVGIDLTPSQIRALRKIEQTSGRKPTAQIRRALRAWLESHDED